MGRSAIRDETQTRIASRPRTHVERDALAAMEQGANPGRRIPLRPYGLPARLTTGQAHAVRAASVLAYCARPGRRGRDRAARPCLRNSATPERHGMALVRPEQPWAATRAGTARSHPCRRTGGSQEGPGDT